MKLPSLVRIVLAVLLVVFLAIPIIYSPPQSVYTPRDTRPILYELVTGWQPAAQRAISAWSAGWVSVSLWIATALAALLITHSMFRWLSANNPNWRLRSTATILALLGAILVFAMSAAGIAHQAGWWFGSAESKWHASGAIDLADFEDALDAEVTISQLVTQRPEVPASELRHAIVQSPNEIVERMLIAVFEDERGMATGVLMTHRKPKARRQVGYILLTARNAWKRVENKNPYIQAGFPIAPGGAHSIDFDDLTKLATEIERLGADPKPFVERFRSSETPEFTTGARDVVADGY